MVKIARGIMFQGTGSDVGKTVIVAALCRLLYNRGVKVLPFKPQNMSNNAAIADDGGEIGRGQWLQAFACGVLPSFHMNPVLLKPQSQNGAQIIVHGKVFGSATGRDYQKLKPTLLEKVLYSYEILAKQCEMILVEGAGSPAEINLRQGDIANMGFAQSANLPVILIGDIDRGGVIASLVGTHKILDKRDCSLVAGYLINKFRGNISLFDDGIKAIEDHTHWPCFGVIPWLEDTKNLPAEDSMALENYFQKKSGKIKIAVPILPHIANFDDLDPLKQENHIEIIPIRQGSDFPNRCDVVLLLGSKATISDMEHLYTSGLADKIKDFANNGGKVIGICGGLQMLGTEIIDDLAIEGTITSMQGLGLLNVVTKMQATKITRNVKAKHKKTSLPINAYEIHIGQTTGSDCANAPFMMQERLEGAASENGQIWGTYLHGLFQNDEFRHAFIKELGGGAEKHSYLNKIDIALDNLARQLEKNVDIKAMFAQAR